MNKLIAVVRKFIKTKNEREVNKLRQQIQEINDTYDQLQHVDLIQETQNFRNELNVRTEEISKQIEDLREKIKNSQDTAERINLKEEYKDLENSRFKIETDYLNQILPRAFALVKETCRRLMGREIDVTGHSLTWDMIPYDVQLIGAIVLHQGKIAEMATGEGKTLAATLPLYLNALPGHGVHLVTVNDYLARRDSEWMGKIFQELGLSVGCIQSGMNFEQRKIQYQKDITYGTNNEFGFDYLRDNIAIHPDNRVQRGHYYCIVDEVDSVLIDEARTPLIISGLVETDQEDRVYQQLRTSVERIIRSQNRLINELISEAEKLLEQDDRIAAGENLLLARKGSPKSKRLMKLEQKTGVKSLIEDTEKRIMVEDGISKQKRMSQLQEELFFTIDEKGHSINITEKGRKVISPDDPDFFTLPDISIMLKDIQNDSTLSTPDKIKKEDEVHRLYAAKSEKIHAINQLLRAYSLYNKDEEYIVVDKKVMIVDEFTGRVLPGRRYSDGLHQALQAKENVPVEAETQVIATITIQNYFRMYTKLAGMTGTAETESTEFHKIYKMDVVVIPTNEPIRRIDYNDKIYKTRREKFNAIIDEITRLHKNDRPVLVGTVSVDVSEMLSRMLSRKGIKHEVLNAKQHQREAEIVTYAGQPGKVTIATNMAGRGTDIKLGKQVVKSPRGCLIQHKGPQRCDFPDDVKQCYKDMPCGLYIIGTSRHESRRIDRQLRGRAGRQGDPGASRFYLSLEDDLMRLFGSEKIARIMDRMGAKEGEVISHPLITRAVENSQKKVEAFNFDIRQRVLKYDEVLNEQRNFIYELRNIVLEGWDLKGQVFEKIEKISEYLIEDYLFEDPDSWDWNAFQVDVARHFGPIKLVEPAKQTTASEVQENIVSEAKNLYQHYESLVTPEKMREIERFINLMVIDEFWRNHLYEMDALREGIGLRGYAQRDPLVEYTIESQKLFHQMLFDMDREIIRKLFHPLIQPSKQRSPEAMQSIKKDFQIQKNIPGQPTQPVKTGKVQTVIKKFPTPGRNDPCPCGSGKKFKACHQKLGGKPQNPQEQRLFELYFNNPQQWQKQTGVKLKAKHLNR